MRLITVILAAALVGGCAAHRKAAADGPAGAAPPSESLSTFIEKVRTLAAQARPPRSNPGTVEQSDPELAAALVALAVMPSAEAHRHAGEAYRRLGVLDTAFDHFQAAVRIDPADALAYEALARIWRDWGVPRLGLGDAWRACYYAPRSAAVHNTRGTLLLAVGDRREARAEFQRALQADASAGYALNNLCYGWFLEGQPSKAVDACRRALALAPALGTVRNNLALAYAASGDLTAARRTFEAGVPPATAQFNLGVVHMAAGRYRDAVAAFATAERLAPGLPQVTARLAEARRLAAPVTP